MNQLEMFISSILKTKELKLFTYYLSNVHKSLYIPKTLLLM